MSEKIEVCFFCGKSFNKFPANYKKVASYADNGGFFHNGCYLDACKNDPNKASAVIRYGKNWEEALKYALKNRKKTRGRQSKGKGGEMKTLGVTQWSDIKVGEVFAAEQYKISHGTVYSILIKLKNRGVIYVDNDYCATDRYNQAQRYTFKKKHIPKDYDNLIFYKLPVAVQRNWIGYGRWNYPLTKLFR